MSLFLTYFLIKEMAQEFESTWFFKKISRYFDICSKQNEKKEEGEKV